MWSACKLPGREPENGGLGLVLSFISAIAAKQNIRFLAFFF